MSEVGIHKGQLLTTGWKVVIVVSFLIAAGGSGHGSSEQQRLKSENHKLELQIKELTNKVSNHEASLNLIKKQLSKTQSEQ